MGDNQYPDAVYWFDPDPRGILPLEDFHVPFTLRKLVRQQKFQIAFDQNFPAVIDACAAPAPGRETTWITPPIRQAYLDLYQKGYAHSVECYLEGKLVGGLYGVALQGAFFGESMFHRVRDASKVALVHLVHHLKKQGFVLLDTQYVTPHLARFGAIEIPRETYHQKLREALKLSVSW